MSMHVHFYLGPYLEVPLDAPDEILDLFEHLACSGRGEAADGDKFRYLIPNQTMPGLDRKMNFEDDDAPEPIALSDAIMSWEIRQFNEGIRPLIARLVAEKIDFEIRWGIVPGIF